MLVKRHAVELARHGITVNGAAPTVVRGDTGAHWRADAAVRDRLLERIPLAVWPKCRTSRRRCCLSAARVQTLYVDRGLSATQ
jgi:NAD(P)-dependent dehydrogenase (short-subunit alcohol dehydrogenase family)